jgi:hypothetical protein
MPEGEEGTVRRRRTAERRPGVSADEKQSDEPGKGPETDEARRPAGSIPDEGHAVPLFLRDGSDGRKGDAQDEKDGVGE